MSPSIEAIVAAWSAKQLPARLDVATTATILGFGEHDIPVLVRRGMLKPLGSPAPNAPKLFFALEIIQLATNRDWLSRASREAAKYWRNKRTHQKQT